LWLDRSGKDEAPGEGWREGRWRGREEGRESRERRTEKGIKMEGERSQTLQSPCLSWKAMMGGSNLPHGVRRSDQCPCRWTEKSFETPFCLGLQRPRTLPPAFALLRGFLFGVLWHVPSSLSLPPSLPPLRPLPPLPSMSYTLETRPHPLPFLLFSLPPCLPSSPLPPAPTWC
jgi:hypothetical protein